MKNNKLKIGIAVALIILLAVIAHPYKITSSSIYDQGSVDFKYVKNFDSHKDLDAEKAANKIYSQEIQTSVVRDAK